MIERDAFIYGADDLGLVLERSYEKTDILRDSQITAKAVYFPIQYSPEGKSLIPDFLRNKTVTYYLKDVSLEGVPNLAEFSDLPFLDMALFEMAEKRGIMCSVEKGVFSGRVSLARAKTSIEVGESMDMRILSEEIESFRKNSNEIWEELMEARKNAMEVYPYRKGK